MGSGLSKDSLSAALTDHLPQMGGSRHCAMIGLDSAGKTTLLYRLKFKQYVNTAPTIGFNCEKIKLFGANYTIWDVGGQDKLRPLWRSYTRCADALIFVVDSCKQERLEEAKLELQKIVKGMTKAPAVLVLANKQDLPSALDVSKLEALLGLQNNGLGAGIKVHIQATCAITGDGLNEGMEILHEMVQSKKKGHSATSPLAPSSGASGSTSGLKGASSTSRLSSKKLHRSNSHL